MAALGSTAAAQELQRVRDAVAQPDAPSTDERKPPPLQMVCGLIGDGGEGTLWALALTTPFTVPAFLLGDDWTRRHYLPNYPYPDKYGAYLLLSPEDAKAIFETDSEGVCRRDFAGRLALEGGTDFSGIHRGGGQLRLDSAYRLGLTSSWNYFSERLSCGGHDELLIGDANFVVRFAQNEIAHLYSGIGARILCDHGHTDGGFNFTYGMDWFPVRPLVVSTCFDAGTLGHAGVVHGRATLGAVYRRWEIYGGYDFLRIDRVNLQGPLVGVRLWF
jgi:hypothetical protein